MSCSPSLLGCDIGLSQSIRSGQGGGPACSSHRLVWPVSRALGAIVLERVRRVLLDVLVLVLEQW